jgi:phosphoribosylformylglycinamidine cyclo-ligase
MNEYAAAGVDYTKLQPFKDAMVAMGQRTLLFPEARGVRIASLPHAHGAVYRYVGGLPHMWCKTTEGLGNKNWIAEWMYQFAGTGRTYYTGIGIDAALMAVNDVIAQGAMPVVYTDEVAAGDSEWFADRQRSADLADGFYRVCLEAGMALPAGESPALKYLVKATKPVKSAPSLSGAVTGIIAPASRLITGEKLSVDDRIIGVPSFGLHANGISLVIKKALELPEMLLTRLPNGNTLGDEALIPTRSYVGFVEALLKAGVDVHALLPGTGDGVAKLAFDKRSYSYRVHSWVEDIPPLFLYMEELGVSRADCLKTFNWGMGYYAFVPQRQVDLALEVSHRAGYEALEIGRVEEGDRKVIYEPDGITLPPPGE